jgi:hypothetical protein
MKLPTITIGIEDLHYGRPRRKWPWRDMQVGDYVDVIAPSDYIRQVRSTALSYARPDGSVRMRAKSLGVRWDEETRRNYGKLRITCEAVP